MRLLACSLFVIVAFSTCEFQPFEVQNCETCTAKGPRCTFCGDGSCRTEGTLDFLSGDKCCTPDQPCYSSDALACPSLQLQCTASRDYGWTTAPDEGQTRVIATNQETGEYATVTGTVIGGRYQARSSVATDFITVRAAGGGVVAAGVTPVDFIAQSSPTYLHYHLNSLCEGSSGGAFRTSSIAAAVGGCRGTSQYGSAVAPDNTGEVRITDLQDPNEYAALGNIKQGIPYTVRTEAPDRFITITFGSPTGSVVAAGMSPVMWVANASAGHFAHFHVDGVCATVPAGSRQSFLANSRAECTATSTYGNVAAPTGGQTVEITSKQAVGEYATVTSAGYNAPFRITSTVATDYVTVRIGTPTGRAIAAGPQPVSFTADFTPQSYYLHFHSSRNCDALDENYRTTRIENLRRECTASLAYGSVTAPAAGETRTITTKQLPNEYATVTNVVSGVQYAFTSRPGDWLTLRIGAANGPAVASGPAPLEYTAAVSGTLFVHYFAGQNCEVDEIERVSTVVAFETGCLADIHFGGTTAPLPGVTKEVAPLYAGEYAQVAQATIGATYSVSSARTTDYLTVRTGSPDGPVIRTGTGATQTFVARDSEFFVHLFLNQECTTGGEYVSVSATGHVPSTNHWAVLSEMFVHTSMRLHKTAVVHPMKVSAAGVLGVIAILGLVQTRFSRKSAVESTGVDPSQSQSTLV